ncbi:hypothetical protein NLJ89_g3882 [Agrocybe chaxingu]|uniref:BTB domain-containing protein n=1 Tax=Agrocybe chaxingu TaxID=84603 RepID=A0A9W8K3R5_9AGAR|nr:hypothetical protein NLJ89_g3882 [Agrocybe chaxingu]
MSSQTMRSQKYYLPDNGMAIFKVEDNLYKVHRYFFIQESSVFQTMFDCPNPVQGQDGESDTQPIHLPEVTRAEFEALLDFFYDGMFNPLLKGVPMEQPVPFNFLGTQQQPRLQHVDVAIQKKLISLLSISLRFAFDRLTKEVITAIDSLGSGMDPIPKIQLALKHETLRNWVPPAFNALVSRSLPLTGDEMKALGPTRSSMICSQREKGRIGLRDPNSGNTTMAVPPEFYDASSF